MSWNGPAEPLRPLGPGFALLEPESGTVHPVGQIVIEAPKLFFPSARVERLAAALLAILLLLAFVPTLLEMGREWFRYAEYGHGVLMPPIALWMIWERRARLAQLRRTGRGSPWLEITAALALIPLGVLLLLGEMRLSWFLKPFAFVGALS